MFGFGTKEKKTNRSKTLKDGSGSILDKQETQIEMKDSNVDGKEET